MEVFPSSRVSFSNYNYDINYTTYNKGVPQEYDIVTYDFYTEFDTKGKFVIEAGFVTGDDYESRKPTLKNGKVIQCEVLNNSSIHYQIEETVKKPTASRSYCYSLYLRPYVIVESGTYYGVRGYATPTKTTYYTDE